MQHGFELTTTDSEEFQEQMSPLVGACRVAPARCTRFDVSVRAIKLNTLSLFTVKAPSLTVDLPPAHRFIGLNIPLGKPFSITESNQVYEFSDDVHLLRPDRHFHLKAASECRVLAICLYSEQVADYASKLSGSRKPFELTARPRIPLSAATRTELVRKIGGLWADLQRDDPALASDTNLAEREDALIASFLLATQDAEPTDDRSAEKADTAAIARAENYLCAHLTRPASRAELAATSGVSIRTLSRGFTKRWGMGPMSFLKARRMDAAYRELLGATPGDTTVTEVAYRYGFGHLGKFAVEYKQAFRESPSATLRN